MEYFPHLHFTWNRIYEDHIPSWSDSIGVQYVFYFVGLRTEAPLPRMREPGPNANQHKQLGLQQRPGPRLRLEMQSRVLYFDQWDDQQRHGQLYYHWRRNLLPMYAMPKWDIN
jgi:hypothetical protein